MNAHYPIYCPEFSEEVLEEFPSATKECSMLLEYRPECNLQNISEAIRKFREIECYFQENTPSLEYDLASRLSEDTMVFKEFIKELDEFIVIKQTNLERLHDEEDDDFDDVLHEAFIGFYAMNNLRKYIPNFVYTYGLFRNPCVYPRSINCNYLLLELIPGQVWTKFIKTATVSEFLNIFLQTCLSLNLARELYGFTHYDLHSDNIIIKKLDKPIEIRYGPENIITTKLVAKIIDFGNAHVKIDGTDYGRVWKKVNVHNYTFWEQDIFKILGFSLGAIDFEMMISSAKEKIQKAQENVDYVEKYLFPLNFGGTSYSKIDIAKLNDYQKKNYDRLTEFLLKTTEKQLKVEKSYQKKMSEIAELKISSNIPTIRSLILKFLSFFNSKITLKTALEIPYYAPLWLPHSKSFPHFIAIVKEEFSFYHKLD